jgi:periplasmic divalent cation tolerance protein
MVTCASPAEARRIARAVVEARLAACVNILPGALTSIYRWKGKVESAKERLLLIKTSRKRLGKLRAAVERLHSYDVPEFIALPIAAGSPAYLDWIEENLCRRRGSYVEISRREGKSPPLKRRATANADRVS